MSSNSRYLLNLHFAEKANPSAVPGIKMSEDQFSTALQKAASATLSLPDLIVTAGRLEADGQPRQAQELYKTWIKNNGESRFLHFAIFNSSVLDSELGDTQAAIESLKTAIALKPDFMPPYINLGRLLEQLGHIEQAKALWRTVVSTPVPITGDAICYVTAALTQIARVLADQLDVENAEDAVQQSLTILPHQPTLIAQLIGMRLSNCKWPIMSPMSGLDRTKLMANTHPLSMTWYTDDPLLQLAAAERFVRLLVDDKPKAPDVDRRDATIDLESRRLRIGYVSSDLRDHAIGYLMTELFELHDKSKMEVFAYYCGEELDSALTNRIKAAVEHWSDIGKLSDDDAARLIATDGIDILVDVNGHTRDGRLGVFARHPAPIMVNWLGFPGSMGSPYHHYIIADDWIIPPGSEMYYSEKVVRLPCYQPNDRKRAIAPVRPTRSDLGLPEGAVVFCCFNGSQKFSKFGVERWLDILKRVPDSVLWLIDTTEQTKTRLANFAEQNGIARTRLIFAPKQQNAYHLARYPLADLFLDSAPYGAHTTASDALWMGVPVLTLSGRSFASRVCGSLVRSAGLADLVCSTSQEYVNRAVELGNNPAAIKAYKAKLEANRSTCQLFDMNKLVSQLEGLYCTMAAEYREGRLPCPDLTNLDAYLLAGIEHDPDVQEVITVADYHGMYKERLHRLHLARPLHSDARLWTQADIAAAQNISKPRIAAALDNSNAAIPAMIKRISDHLAAGELVRAEECAATLAMANPTHKLAQNVALSCNLSLGRRDETVKYARALVAIEPSHLAAHSILAEHCKETGDIGGEIEHRAVLALKDKADYSPLLKLRDIHDAASLILCRNFNLRGLTLVQDLLAGASRVVINAPAGSEWAAWEKHYRLMLDAVDLPALLGKTPESSTDMDTTFATSSGLPLDWQGVQATAERLGVQTVFFAAADEAYVDLYARWYALSVLKYSDVPCLVIVHVIGGAKNLERIAKSVGVNDPRLIIAGDAFNASAVATKCYDAPPKGLIAKPVAHFQSARFFKVGALLQNLRRPVFVSDIDLLLQRGVSDLLQRCAGADIVLNENTGNLNAGSRLTANLVLLYPTDSTTVFLRFLRGYLDHMLGKAEVSRWIDQLGLIMALHHLRLNVLNARIAFFDTNSDINNVMYRSYQKHPFRFLSLYHGFDTSSLEGSLDAPRQETPTAQGANKFPCLIGRDKKVA